MKNKIKSLTWVDFLMECLLSPSKLALRVKNSENKIHKYGFIFPVFSTGISILSMSVLTSQDEFFYYKITYGWILLVIITVSQIFIIAALTDLIFQLRGKQGNVKKIVEILNFSFFPKILILAPVMLFVSINFAAPFWYFCMTLLTSIWGIYIVVRGLSEIFNVDIFSALVTYALPYVIGAVTGFSIMLLSGFLLYGRLITI